MNPVHSGQPDPPDLITGADVIRGQEVEPDPAPVVVSVPVSSNPASPKKAQTSGKDVSGFKFSTEPRKIPWMTLGVLSALVLAAVAVALGAITLRTIQRFPRTLPAPAVVPPAKVDGDGLASRIESIEKTLKTQVEALESRSTPPKAEATPKPLEVAPSPEKGVAKVPEPTGVATPEGTKQAPTAPGDVVASPPDASSRAEDRPPPVDLGAEIGKVSRTVSRRLDQIDARLQGQDERVDRLYGVFGTAIGGAAPCEIAVIAFNTEALPFNPYQAAYADAFLERPVHLRYKGQRVSLWLAVTDSLQKLIPFDTPESKLDSYRGLLGEIPFAIQATERPDLVVNRLVSEIFQPSSRPGDLPQAPRRCVFIVSAGCRAPEARAMTEGEPEIDVVLIAPGAYSREQFGDWLEFCASRKGVLRLIRDDRPQPSKPDPGNPPKAANGSKPAVAEPKPTTVAEPKPTTVAEPKPTTVAEPKPTTVAELKPTTVASPKPGNASSTPVANAPPASTPAPSPHTRLVEPLKRELRRLLDPLVERR